MYARLRTTRTSPEIPDIETHPGFAGRYVLEQLGTGWGTVLTLWQRPSMEPADDMYEVEDDIAGMAAGEPPQAAAAVYFDGPLSPARVAAARYGFQERIRPVLEKVPGLVRIVLLWHPQEAKAASFSLATSLEAVEEGGRAVNSTELLPGEDPALLTGPDRFEIHRVVATEVPS